MESILIFALIAFGAVQVVMIIKFFDLASDIRDIRDVVIKTIKDGDRNQSNSVGDLTQGYPIGSPKLTWQTWVALIVILVVIIIYLINFL